MLFNTFRFGFALAALSLVQADSHKWQAPTAGQVRSPCPGLNTLANHGYIARSGKGISITDILDAALAGYNLSNDTLTNAAKLGLLSGDAATTLDLDALALHGLIEHDASISRQDIALGDNLHFNETLFSVMANINPGSDVYTPATAAQVMKMRLDNSLANNPNVTNTDKEFVFRSGEAALYLSIFGNVTTGIAPKKFVNIFFREERMPIEEGWKRSETQITLETLNERGALIRSMVNWTATQTCEAIVIGPGATLNAQL